MKKLLLIFLFVLTLCACGLQEESVLEEPEILESSATKPVENELKEEKPSHLILVPLFVETFYTFKLRI